MSTKSFFRKFLSDVFLVDKNEFSKQQKREEKSTRVKKIEFGLIT